MNNESRNYGIDCLRLLSMFLVVFGHIVLFGHTSEISLSRTQELVLKALYLLAFPAVNIFALISGYLGIYAKHRLKSIVFLWCEVFFWSIFLMCLAGVCGHHITLWNVYAHLCPVYHHCGYWYFRHYFILFFWMPVLNSAIESSPQSQMKKILLSLFCIFSVFPTFTPKHSVAFGLNEGFSVMWLAFLYLLGAYVRKYSIGQSISSKKLLYICLALFAGMFLIDVFCINTSGVVKLILGNQGFIMRYTTPPLVGISLIMLILFSRLNITSVWIKKALTVFAPLAFGVYLIHEHVIFSKILYVGKMDFLMAYSPFAMAIGLLAVAIGIFGASLLLEWLRHWISKSLFQAMQKINLLMPFNK